MLSRRQGLAADTHSIAAVEFGMVTPVLLTLLLGGFDLARALVVWEEAFGAAQGIVEAAEKRSVPQSGTVFNLTAADAQTAMTSLYAEMPGLPSTGDSKFYDLGLYSVTLSSIVLTPLGCTVVNASPCTPFVAWSVVLQEGRAGQILTSASLRRPCGTPLGTVPYFPFSPNAANNLLVVPISLVPQQTSMVVADVQYQFTPMFFQFITGAITFWASAAFPVPGGDVAQDYVQYTPQNDPGVCPGYL